MRNNSARCDAGARPPPEPPTPRESWRSTVWQGSARPRWPSSSGTLAEQYPDGQLFLDLHGHTPGRAALTARAALARMLRAVGVGEDRIGDDVDELAELWRSRVSGLRLLIVLDNASDAEHIRPLIPGRGGSLVLVTSRRRLLDLDTAAVLSLDALPPTAAYALFAQVAGPRRVIAQDADVREAVRRCGHLPLAVRIAAARLRHRPAWRVSDLLEHLDDTAADGESPVAGAFEMSYLRLDPEQQRMFRSLGLHPGADVDIYGAAALAGLPRRTAAQLVEGLHDHHLVEEHMPRRYTFHDLMREYARNKSAETGDAEGDDSALLRLLDHYRYTVSVAMDQTNPSTPDLRPTIDPPGTDVPRLDDAVSATDWIEAELANLLACAALATERRWTAHVTQTTDIIWEYLYENARYRDAYELNGFAIAAARAASDRGNLGMALRFQGSACMHLGRFREAFAALEEARGLSEEPSGLAIIAERLGTINHLLGRIDQAAAEFEQGIALWRSAGRMEGVANCLANIAIIYFKSGRYEESRDNLLEALATHGKQIDPAYAAPTLAWLGTVTERTGHYAQACEYAEQALEVARSESQSGSEAIALSVRGRARQQLGLLDESLADLERSLEIRRGALELPDVCVSLLSLGTHHYRRGVHQRAANYFREALDLTQDLDIPASRLGALIGLGESLTGLGHPDSALIHHRRALELAREVGDPYLLARAQEGLGSALHAVSESAGTPDPALLDETETHLRQAHAAYLSLGVPDAERLKAGLAT